MLKRFFENREEIDDFIFALEKLTNIALVKASRFENKTVLEILESLKHYILKLYDLKNSRNERYNQLLLSYEAYTKKPKLNLPSPRFDIEGKKQTEQNTFFFKDLYEKKERLEESLFNMFLGYFVKIWESAIRVGNDEVSRHTIYRIVLLLAKISQDDNNRDLIRVILSYLNHLTITIFVKYGGNIADRSIYPASIDWYIDIIFFGFGQNDEEIQT